MRPEAASAGSADSAESMRWALAAAAAADDKKGIDTLVIDVGDVISVTDAFVITHGANPRQVRAVVEGVEAGVKAAGGPALVRTEGAVRIEGTDARQWVLLDYGCFVVHVFDAETRAFYQLERLWGDCPVVDWQAQAALAKT